jgi:hypothetical protein
MKPCKKEIRAIYICSLLLMYVQPNNEHVNYSKGDGMAVRPVPSY